MNSGAPELWAVPAPLYYGLLMRSTHVFMDPKKVYQQRTKSKTNATFYKRQTLYQHIIKGNNNLRGACLVETSYLFIWHKENEDIKKSI
jgi:hypothetical protein